MLPGVLSDNDVDLDVTADSNVGSPGVFAFRVDMSMIAQPGGRFMCI